MDDRQADILRRYSRGELTSRSAREMTGMDYVHILGGLHELGLRQPIARLDGINGPALQRGRALLLSVLTEDQAR